LVFYHIYPLGFSGAPEVNDFSADPVKRLDKLYGWIDYLVESGYNAIYFGPLFESTSHGYDTVNYYSVDRRLGTNDSFRDVCRALKERGFKIYLDGVFNHVSRDFVPFQDLLEKGEESAYRDWFKEVDFSQNSPQGDPFSYGYWEGHDTLVSLNLKNQEVRTHLLSAVKFWMDEFFIDGLRLDVAYCLDRSFLKELKEFTSALKSDFWIMGEIIHGDCREWIDNKLLDSATNYECYKGIYSSLNDQNYFEIAYSLNRLFGEQGIYRNYKLYNFLDNHDVNRIRSILNNKAHIYNAVILLFSIPGFPSIYYGSEWQIEGEKTDNSDALLRPAPDLSFSRSQKEAQDLEQVLRRLIFIRKETPVLEDGNYRELLVSSRCLVFERELNGKRCICAVNSSDEEENLSIPLQGFNAFTDKLNNNEQLSLSDGHLFLHLWPNWGSILLENE
jgi:glycosidase